MTLNDRKTRTWFTKMFELIKIQTINNNDLKCDNCEK